MRPPAAFRRTRSWRGKHIGKLGGDRQTGVRLVAVPTPDSAARAANLIDAAGLFGALLSYIRRAASPLPTSMALW